MRANVELLAATPRHETMRFDRRRAAASAAGGDLHLWMAHAIMATIMLPRWGGLFIQISRPVYRPASRREIDRSPSQRLSALVADLAP